jgi:tetratricopeptide (TPR) repeat protein
VSFLRILAVWLIVLAVAGLTSAQDSIAPGRPELRPVPMPPLDSLEPVVAEQLRAAQRELQPGAGRQAGNRDLADRYGTFGQVAHAYEFFESAEAAYLNAMRLASNDVRWRHLLGYLYQQTGRLEDAAEQFGTVRRLDPERREAAIRLGDTYVQLNRLREAREQFEEVLDVFPALARNGLGEVALRERRFDEAIAHFRAVLDRVPTASAVHYSLAMAYRGLGRFDDARAQLQRRGTGALRPGDPVVDGLQALVRGERGLVMQGRRAYEAGQFKAAADAFGQALAAAPESVTSRVNLGLALAQLGNAADAAAQFEAALRREPGNVEAHAGLGMVLAGQGSDPAAADHLRRAFDATPEDTAVRNALLRVLVRLRRDAEAISVLEKIRSVDPDDEETIVSLSILLADQGRFGDALTLLEEAHRRFPERAPTATTLARLLASSPDRAVRNGQRALDVARAVYGAEPTAVHAETVALALAELGRCAEALEWMRRAIENAEGVKDATQASRLKAEVPKYGSPACRP